jgi:hypothetical protein
MSTDGKARHIFLAAILSALLIVVIDALTNALDLQKFSWDFRYYIGMAQNGFDAPLASPFAYRYLTPFLVYGLTHLFGVSIENGFRSIAYLGAFLQLIGVFLFTNRFTHSIKGAYTALVITAFSLFNVKFLLFDIYRPDHLAYALILLQAYFAFERKFLPLLLTTLIALQVREFNLIPLIAYLFAFARQKERATFIRELLLSAIGVTLAILLPRILVPVNENFQFADLSRDGMLRVLIAPFVLARDVNFVYSLAAYLLPILMLAGIKNVKSISRSFDTGTRSFLMVYVGLVSVFSFLGGTDFYRFSTYLFLPQVLALGFLSQTASNLELTVMGIAVFLFNRIWLPFPMSDSGTYLDFYGAFADRFNWASFLRIIECCAFIALGFMIRRLYPVAGSRPAGPLQNP